MIPFALAVASRRYKRAVMAMFAQGGKSDTVLDLIGHRFDQRPAPVLYVGPSQQFLREQFEPRILDLLTEAPTLKGKLARGKKMTKTRKVIAGVPLRLAHAGSSTALKSDPFALALTDEADELMANVKGQGNPIALIDRRGETYADFVHAIVSTPSEGAPETEIDPESGLEFWTTKDLTKIRSTIWKLYLQGTRYHWTWRCTACGERFVPRFSCLRIPDVEDADGKLREPTPSEAREVAHLVCPRNGCILTDADKTELQKSGQPVAPGQRITATGEVVGEPAENTTASFWASGLASPFKSFGDRAAQYIEAKQSGDHSELQAVMNGSFGEPYADVPLNAPKWEEVRAKSQPYKLGEVPREVIRLVAGIDVQGLGVYYVLRGFGARGSSWLVENGFLHGLTDDDKVWDDLADLLLSPHGGMHVERALIDAGYRPDKPDAGDYHRVHEFARRYDWLVNPTRGRQTLASPLVVNKLEVTAKGKKASFSVDLVNVNTDFFKSLVLSRIRTPAGRLGSFHVPQDVSEGYCRQMVSEVREIEAGKPVWKPVSRENHYFDCEALAAAAGYLLNVQRIPEGSLREWDEAAPPVMTPPVVEVEGAGDPTPVIQTPAATALSLRDRMAARAARFNR